MHVSSPRDFSNWLQNAIERIAFFTAHWIEQSRQRKLFFYLSISIISLLFLIDRSNYIPHLSLQDSATHRSEFRLLDFSDFGIGVLLFLGPILHFFDHDPRKKNIFLIIIGLIGILSWLFSYNHKLFEKSDYFSLSVATLILILPYLLLSYFPRTRRLKALIWIFAVVGLGMCVALLDLNHFISIGAWPTHSNRVLMVVLFVVAEFPLLAKSSFDFSLWRIYFFSPLHLICPIPIRFMNLQTESNVTLNRVLALRDFAFAVLCLNVLNFLDSRIANHEHSFSYGFFMYLQTYLRSVIAISTPIAILRWYGWTLPNAFELPLLAHSPADRWRRWNTYFFNWFNSILFIPIFKKTGLWTLGLIAAFGFSAFVHFGANLDYFLVSGDPKFLTKIYSTLLFFALHGVAVFISMKWPWLFGRETERSGWIGLLITWLFMCFIHIYTP